MTTAFGDVCFWGNSGHWAMSALPPKVGKKNLHVAKLVRAPHKDRLSQLRTKESDVCHETGQQPLEEAHDRKNFAFRRAASSSHPQRLAAQVTVVGQQPNSRDRGLVNLSD